MDMPGVSAQADELYLLRMSCEAQRREIENLIEQVSENRQKCDTLTTYLFVAFNLGIIIGCSLTKDV